MVRFQPKLTTTHKILRLLDEACQSRLLTRDLAGRLRGDLNWMYSMCAGFGGKLAGPLLSRCQQADSTTLSAEEIYTLEMLRHLVANYRPREVPLLHRGSPVLRVYSDASFEGGELRLGWVLFPPGCQPVGGTCLVPPAVLQSWNVRQQQIFPGESLCGLLVPWLHPQSFCSADVVWFIDNESAVASLIKASSDQPDVHRIVQTSQAVLQALGARTWFEWIDTESNPSDGLSRDGLLDVWTQSQGWSLKDYSFPPELLPDTFSSLLEHLLSGVNSGWVILFILDSGCLW